MFNETFKIDRKFIGELRRRLVKTNRKPYGMPLNPKHFKSDEIPTPKQLADIISNLMWASTQLEEGRLTRFRVGFTRGLALEHLALVFDLPFPWSVEEIRKLAPAVRPPDGQLCVHPFFPGSEKLYIHGLQTTSFHEVTFEIIEPARLIVRAMLNIVVAEVTGQRSGFIDENWRKKVGELMVVKQSDRIPFVSDLLYLLYSGATKGILNRIRQLRHGGTLIFVSDEKAWKRSAERQAYEGHPKFRYNGFKQVEQNLKTELLSALEGKNQEPEEARRDFMDTGLKLGKRQIQSVYQRRGEKRCVSDGG